ncbi:pentatricopeptide repeat-containing protein At5g66520-like [Vigna unguiculata]|uniref:Structure-specific endonuclease subunit SLX1 n=1 Tax=Vigna unguiculata TaxID=3917 RepID=A0A4D6LKE3_VIGUN|nr:pentatricopeptide repeat-containing protein At5g66520-like [Vigna unguiculata]QCD89003.1 structure-specific endonuclease subunit SLX1 [Vigna unguiculata]
MSSTSQKHNLVRLLEQCSTMREMKQIHAYAITTSLARFTFISSKLLAFYAHADLRHAHTLFSRIPFPTLFHYNTIIAAFSRRSSSLFLRMLNDTVRPNARTFTLLLSKASPSLSFLQQLHSLILRLGHLDDPYVATSLVAAYSNHACAQAARRVFDESPDKNVACCTSLLTGYCNNGLVNDAREVFDAIPDKNDVSYSAMVSGYVRNGFFRDAIQLFRDLKKNCFATVKPNNSLLASVLGACAAIGAFEEGRWIHSYVHRNGELEYHQVELGTALIDFYAKCGCVEPAERVFGKMKSKDVAAWSAMILGLAINGKNRWALELFAEMEKVGPRPNGVTFIGVLTACNDKELFGRAVTLFEYMREKHGIAAWIEHYGCVVDVLARAGKIEEAVAFMSGMEMEADGAIWGCLVNGCLMHGYVELGHRIGRYLVEFECGHGGRYVVLAKFYAGMGRWEAVSDTRNLMKRRGVPPLTASSFIEIHASASSSEQLYIHC